MKAATPGEHQQHTENNLHHENQKTIDRQRHQAQPEAGFGLRSQAVRKPWLCGC